MSTTSLLPQNNAHGQQPLGCLLEQPFYHYLMRWGCDSGGMLTENERVVDLWEQKPATDYCNRNLIETVVPSVTLQTCTVIQQQVALQRQQLDADVSNILTGILRCSPLVALIGEYSCGYYLTIGEFLRQLFQRHSAPLTPEEQDRLCDTGWRAEDGGYNLDQWCPDMMCNELTLWEKAGNVLVLDVRSTLYY